VEHQITVRGYLVAAVALGSIPALLLIGYLG
jgi:hypothetical protein